MKTTRIAIIGCKRIQDQLCVACAKCLKGMSEREGEFSRYRGEDVELIALGHCGDCPGLIIPKIKLMKEVAQGLDRDFDVIHLGTCVVKARKTALCPLDFDKVAAMVKDNFQKDMVVGTHPY
jgi:predicted metal-binding protein